MTPFIPSLDQQRLMRAGRGPSFWLPINLLDIRLPSLPEWIEDLEINWEIGFTSSPQTKIWTTIEDNYSNLHHFGQEVLLIKPLFGEGSAKPQDWHTRGGLAGLHLSLPYYLAAVHKFRPSLLFAEVTLDGLSAIEPYAKAWGKPKSAMSATERNQWGL